MAIDDESGVVGDFALDHVLVLSFEDFVYIIKAFLGELWVDLNSSQGLCKAALSIELCTALVDRVHVIPPFRRVVNVFVSLIYAQLFNPVPHCIRTSTHSQWRTIGWGSWGGARGRETVLATVYIAAITAAKTKVEVWGHKDAGT